MSQHLPLLESPTRSPASIARKLQRRAIAVFGFLLCCFLTFGVATDALASIHAYPDTLERTMFRSLQSLRDHNDLSWQLVFFDWVDRGQIDTIHLRLVGFPGLELERAPLQISASTGQRWTAPDVSATALKTGELPANAGEFDLAEVMRDLHNETTLELAFDLRDRNRIELTVPIAIVREWRSTIETSL